MPPTPSPTSTPAAGPRVASALPLKKRIKIAVVSAAGAVLMRVLGCTMRLRAPGMEQAQPYLSAQGSLLAAQWHGDHFPVLYAYRHQGFYVITSQSADGQILTNVLASLGYRCVRGSSTRGGIKALIELARIVRRGALATIAVDGPRGPRRQAKPGIVLLAKMTGCSVLPVGAAMDRYWEFHSWDRYRIPKPFSRALILLGEPITVPPDADDQVLEAKRLELEHALVALAERAEREVKESPGQGWPGR
jgi:lysophospholipid acyltransferase (LPLAT)-like uncharacterized protein